MLWIRRTRGAELAWREAAVLRVEREPERTRSGKILTFTCEPAAPRPLHHITTEMSRPVRRDLCTPVEPV